MLRRHERQQLTRIEQRLEESDPRLARTLRDGDRTVRRHSLNRRSTRIALDIFAGVLLVLALAAAEAMVTLLSLAAVIAATTMHIRAAATSPTPRRGHDGTEE